jgi:hypothetical protein
MPFYNKLERLSLESLSWLVYCLQARLDPTRVKHFSGAPLLGRLLASPTNIRLGWEGWKGTNALAYFEKA